MRRLFYQWVSVLLMALAFNTAHAANDEPDMVYGFCPPGQMQDGANCRTKCDDGYQKGVLGGSCAQNCKSGFTDLGVSCSDLDIKPRESYGRFSPTALQCSPDKETGLFGLCYARCRANYVGAGSTCWENCPAGTDVDAGAYCVRTPRIVGWGGPWYWRYPIIDWGWVHTKDVYTRSTNAPNQCTAGREQVGLACLPVCNAGYTGSGGTCWKNCPSGYKTDFLGLSCIRDNGYVKQVYWPPVQGKAEVCPSYPKNTKFPIILVHGTFGFDTMGPLGSYFHGVAEALRKGGATVYGVTVSAVASNEERGDQLVKFVETVANRHHSPVHLIGHSHGAPTSRYVAGKHPEWVASITTIGGVNYGSNAADLLLKVLPDGSPQQNIAGPAVNVLGDFITVASGQLIADYTQNATGALHSLTTAGSENFNQRFPRGLHGKGQSASTPLDVSDGKGGKARPMLFYSWTGKAPYLRPGLGTPFMAATHAAVFATAGENSDGLVGEKSAYFGQFLGAYHHDHLTEVLGAVEDTSNNTIAHPLTLYCEHADRLRQAEENLLKPAYIEAHIDWPW